MADAAETVKKTVEQTTAKAKAQAEYDAKVANAEKWAATMTAYEKLDAQKKADVDAILSAVAVAEEPAG